MKKDYEEPKLKVVPMEPVSTAGNGSGFIGGGGNNRGGNDRGGDHGGNGGGGWR